MFRRGCGRRSRDWESDEAIPTERSERRNLYELVNGWLSIYSRRSLDCARDDNKYVMDNKQNNFIQSNSPDGGFLQSVYWRKFQESVGRETYYISASDGSEELIAFANIIEHKLPIAGKYFYVPRGAGFEL